MKTAFTFRSPWFLFVSTLALATGTACAQPADAKPLPLGDTALETAFWDCDVLATHEMLPMSVGAQCAIVSDALKQRRFGGDFERLLAWWRDNKGREHALRDKDAADPLRAP